MAPGMALLVGLGRYRIRLLHFAHQSSRVLFPSFHWHRRGQVRSVVTYSGGNSGGDTIYDPWVSLLVCSGTGGP